MANKLTRLGGPGKFGAWVRYGGKPITQQQLDFAVKNYSVAILQPWELDAARYLKKRAPQMVVLAYKCLSSTRSYEPGPIYSSGVSYPLAQSMANSGKDFFAHRLNGDRIEWKGYPKHFQMQVWNADYRWQWVDAVVREMRNSPFDGVMADNDIENDYYDLNLPIQGVESMTKIREHLDFLVAYAGIELNKIGKILVPNIAESRLRYGKWERHSAYGGGFEEVWLGWGPNDYLSSPYAVMQGREIANGSAGDVNLGTTFAGLGGRSAASQKKVTILRTPLRSARLLLPVRMRTSCTVWRASGCLVEAPSPASAQPTTTPTTRFRTPPSSPMIWGTRSAALSRRRPRRPARLRTAGRH